MRMDELDLSASAHNVLLRAGAVAAEKIKKMRDDDQSRIRNLNEKCLKEVKRAALIMDMPEACVMCDFVENQHPRMYCGVPGIGEDVTDYIACRPECCPLREMPEKMELCGKYPQPGKPVPSYRCGWNACLDEILK